MSSLPKYYITPSFNQAKSKNNNHQNSDYISGHSLLADMQGLQYQATQRKTESVPYTKSNDIQTQRYPYSYVPTSQASQEYKYSSNQSGDQNHQLKQDNTMNLEFNPSQIYNFTQNENSQFNLDHQYPYTELSRIYENETQKQGEAIQAAEAKYDSNYPFNTNNGKQNQQLSYQNNQLEQNYTSFINKEQFNGVGYMENETPRLPYAEDNANNTTVEQKEIQENKKELLPKAQENNIKQEPQNNIEKKQNYLQVKIMKKPQTQRVQVIVDQMSRLLNEQIDQFFVDNEISFINTSDTKSQNTSRISCRTPILSGKDNQDYKSLYYQEKQNVKTLSFEFKQIQNQLQEQISDLQNQYFILKDQCEEKNKQKRFNDEKNFERKLQKQELEWTVGDLEKEKLLLSQENKELKQKLQMERSLKSPSNSINLSHKRLKSSDCADSDLRKKSSELAKIAQKSKKNSDQIIIDVMQTSKGSVNNEQNKLLLEQIEKLKETHEEQNATLNDQLSQLQDNILSLKKECEKSQYQLKEQTLQNKLLQSQLQNKNSNNDQDIQDFSQQLRQLQEEFKQSKQSNQEKQYENEQKIYILEVGKKEDDKVIQNLQIQNAELQSQNQELVMMADEQVQQVKKTYEVILDNEKENRKNLQKKYEKENKILQDEIKGSLNNKTQIFKLQEKLTEIEQEKKNIQQEVFKLENQVQDLQYNKNDLEKTIQAQKDQIEDSAKEFEETLFRYRNQIQEQGNTHSNSKSIQNQEILNLQNQVSELQNELLILQTEQNFRENQKKQSQDFIQQEGEEIKVQEILNSVENSIINDKESIKQIIRQNEEFKIKLKKILKERDFQDEFLKELQSINQKQLEKQSIINEEIFKLKQKNQIQEVDFGLKIQELQEENMIKEKQNEQLQKDILKISQEKNVIDRDNKIQLQQSRLELSDMQRKFKTSNVENQLLKETYEARLQELEDHNQQKSGSLLDSSLIKKSNKKKSSPSASMRSSISGRSKEETHLQYKKLLTHSQATAALMSNKRDYHSLQDMTKSDVMSETEQEINKQVIRDFNTRQSLNFYSRNENSSKKSIASSKRSKDQIREQYAKLKKMGQHTASMFSVKQDYTSLKDLIQSQDVQQAIKEVNEEIIKENQKTEVTEDNNSEVQGEK